MIMYFEDPARALANDVWNHYKETMLKFLTGVYFTRMAVGYKKFQLLFCIICIFQLAVLFLWSVQELEEGWPYLQAFLYFL